jgi:hypothetical protein
MAQTKRKRQTKHRGNAAGVVESRGRTGRKPTAAEKSGKAQDAKQAKERPTWLGAFYRSMAAAVVLLLACLLLKIKSTQAIALFPLALVIYTPISYYTDRLIFKRRLRRKAATGAGKASAR